MAIQGHRPRARPGKGIGRGARRRRAGKIKRVEVIAGGTAIDEIARTGHQSVPPGPTIKRVVPPIGIGARDDAVIPITAKGHVRRKIGGRQVDDIIPGLAMKCIGPGPPDQRVISRPTQQRVISRPAVDAVIAFLAIGDVVACPPKDRIAAAAGKDGVIAIAAIDVIVERAFLCAVDVVDQVIPGTAKDDIPPCAEIDRIVPVAAIYRIAAGTRTDRIRPGAAEQHIISKPADDGIGPTLPEQGLAIRIGRCIQRIVEFRPANDFRPGKTAARQAAAERIVGRVISGEGDADPVAADEIGKPDRVLIADSFAQIIHVAIVIIGDPGPIVASPAKDRIVPRPPVKRVIPVATKDQVIATAADDAVIAGPAKHRVVAVIGAPAADRVISVPAVDGIRATPAKDAVIARPCRNRVVATSGIYRVIASTRGDVIIPVRDLVALRVRIADIHRIRAGRAIDGRDEIPRHPFRRKITRIRGHADQRQRQDGFGRQRNLIGIVRKFRRKIGVAVHILEHHGGNHRRCAIGIGDRRIIGGNSVKILRRPAIDAERVIARRIVRVIGVGDVDAQTVGRHRLDLTAQWGRA